MRPVRAKTVAPGPELAAAVGRPLDWQHAASVPLAGALDSEALARACFEGAPFAMRLFLTVGWRLLLLEGRPVSDSAHVLGWPVVATTPGSAVLQRRSRLGIIATLVFTVTAGTATFASGMTFDNRAARVVWAVVAPTHRWAVRVALGHAAQRHSSPR